MRWKILLPYALFLLISLHVKSQLYPGYQYNNYQGAAGVIFNPANIVYMPYKYDIHLFSVNASVTNNAYQIKKSIIFKNNDTLIEGKDYSLMNNNGSKHVAANVDVSGPGLMISLSPRDAISFTTRVRVISKINNLDNDVLRALDGSDSSYYKQNYSMTGLRANAHGIADFAVSYARVLYQDNTHLLKAGITAKYVIGVGAASVQADNMSVNVRNVDTINNITGNIKAFYSDGAEKLFDNTGTYPFGSINKSSGIGLDIGAVYEVYEDGKAPNPYNYPTYFQNIPTYYKYRLSFSITDIGSLSYKLSANAQSYTVNATNVPTTQLEVGANESLNDYFTRLQARGYVTAVGKPSGYKVALPTMMHLNFDYQLQPKFFINANADINLLGKNTYGSGYLTTLVLTPRYETKWFSVFSPITYSAYNQLSWGLGASSGIFYIGSGTLFSNLFKSDISRMNVYLGLHIPIFKRNNQADCY
ncbi:DUF5723 family protein [Chitinophagaceae bacterium LWZ2-11]